MARMAEVTRPPCKVVLIGEMGSGKSNILLRLLHNRFDPDSVTTIGAAFGTKRIETMHGVVTLHIWDTTGDEKYRSIANLYYRKAVAAIVCCDLTVRESYEKLDYWITQVRNTEDSCKMYICGTKVDLIKDQSKPRLVSTTELERFASPVVETSSKTNYNITELFQMIADEYQNRNRRGTKNLVLHEAHENEDQPRKCCSRG